MFPLIAVAKLAGAFTLAGPAVTASDALVALTSDTDPTSATPIDDGRPFDPAVAVDAAYPSLIVTAAMDRRLDANGIRTIWLRTHGPATAAPRGPSPSS